MIYKQDSECNNWDFTKVEMREKARAYVISNKPPFLIGSPPCDQWSIMQNLNTDKLDEETKRLLILAGVKNPKK